MTQFEQLEVLLNEQGGMIQTSEAVKRGISKPVFYNYVKEKIGAGGAWNLCIAGYLD